jgi:hypothetical protein
MVLQPPQACVCSGSQSLETSACVSRLEAEIAQLKEALRQRKQIGVATGLPAGASRLLLSRPGRSRRQRRPSSQWRW